MNNFSDPLDQPTRKSNGDSARVHFFSASNHELPEFTAESALGFWLRRLHALPANATSAVILGCAVEAATAIASTPRGNIQIYNPARRGLELKCHRGFQPPFLEYFDFVGGDHCACGAALKNRRPIAVADVTTNPLFSGRTLQVMCDADARSVSSTPLIGKNENLLGMFSVHYPQPRQWTDADLRRLDTLARAISARLETA